LTARARGGSKRGSGLDPQCYCTGKKVPVRKRHIFFDIPGLLLNDIVLSADVQDRHAAGDLLNQTRSRSSFVERIFADGGYSGAKTAAMVRSTGCWKIEIVKRSDAHRFVVLPKRRIVERTFAWISHNRRLMRESERYASTAVAFVRPAMIRILLKCLTRQATVPESYLCGWAPSLLASNFRKKASTNLRGYSHFLVPFWQGGLVVDALTRNLVGHPKGRRPTQSRATLRQTHGHANS
jgi:transposase